jgi:hypothetical protein
MRRVQVRRLERLEVRHRRNCVTCYLWMEAVLIDDDGNLARPESCPECGRHVPVTVRVQIVGVPLDVS